jgi:outer membrane receptor for ferrienterochelin and colicin
MRSESTTNHTNTTNKHLKKYRTFVWFVWFVVALSSLPAQEDDFDVADLPDFGEAGGVTVEGTPETTQQMRVITKDEIEKRNSQDLASLLEESLDMSITRYGGYGNQTELNMRGFDTERIAVLIDGVPANSPRSGEFDINQVDLNNVERIEVIYGGSDTKYNVSGALGGCNKHHHHKKTKAGLKLRGHGIEYRVCAGGIQRPAQRQPRQDRRRS